MSRALRGCRISLAVCGAVGLLMLGTASLMRVSPHIQLDRVLTPSQLEDRQLRDETLTLLKKAQGNEWALWLAAGAVVAMAAGAGLILSCRSVDGSPRNSEIVPRRPEAR